MGHQFEDVKSIKRGETPTFRMTAESEKTGQPIDFTDATLSFMVKNSEDDLDVDAIITKAAVTNDPTHGKASVKLTKEETDRRGEFFAELMATYDGGLTVIRPIQFTLKIGIGIHDVV